MSKILSDILADERSLMSAEFEKKSMTWSFHHDENDEDEEVMCVNCLNPLSDHGYEGYYCYYGNNDFCYKPKENCHEIED